MPKIICHMHNGHPFTIKSGVLVPGKPGEVECTEYQARCLAEDCRVVILTKEELKAKAAAEKAAAKAAAEKAAAEKAAAKKATAKKAAAKKTAAAEAAAEQEFEAELAAEAARGED